MQEALVNLTNVVAHSAGALAQRYGSRRLYALRVSVRRIRTFLKQSGGHRARRLRKTWGAFAAITNEARDWDVFHKTARALLSPEDYRTFQRLNRKRLRASHRAVTELVRSTHWNAHLEEWRRYLERSADHDANAPPEQSLEVAQATAGTALALAMEANDDRAWHKFRIAVKETRYIAEAAGAPPPWTSQVIATCVSLQATLGEWHDTVIQLQLLDELVADPVHARLRRLISAKKKRSLSQTRALLSVQSEFVPR
jgi:CHAD domain-containing protein